MKRIEVLLEGGLGNQLFGWATGYSLAKSLGFNLVLNTSQLITREFQLNRFDLGQYSVTSQKRIILSNRRLAHYNPKVFNEKDFTYDNRIEKISSSKFLIGFFQSWKYFSEELENIRPLIKKLSNPSSEYLHYRNMLREQDSLIVHVRRGDYKNAAHFHGLVSEDYYSKAMVEAQKIIPNGSKLIVMSDEPELAKEIIGHADLYIGPEDLPSAAETLLLMSEAKYLIGANSSFSLWAGMLMSQTNSLQIFPDPWFKVTSIDTSDLIPPSFKRVRASL